MSQQVKRDGKETSQPAASKLLTTARRNIEFLCEDHTDTRETILGLDLFRGYDAFYDTEELFSMEDLLLFEGRYPQYGKCGDCGEGIQPLPFDLFSSYMADFPHISHNQPGSRSHDICECSSNSTDLLSSSHFPTSASDSGIRHLHTRTVNQDGGVHLDAQTANSIHPTEAIVESIHDYQQREKNVHGIPWMKISPCPQEMSSFHQSGEIEEKTDPGDEEPTENMTHTQESEYSSDKSSGENMIADALDAVQDSPSERLFQNEEVQPKSLEFLSEITWQPTINTFCTVELKTGSYKEMIRSFHLNDDSSSASTKRLCPGCNLYKTHIFYYLGTKQQICNACNQHWRRHKHDCLTCDALVELCADPLKRGVSMKRHNFVQSTPKHKKHRHSRGDNFSKNVDSIEP